MKVYHWQESGVAWAPWRYAKVASSDGVEVRLFAPAHEIECYGLDDRSVHRLGGGFTALLDQPAPDILHLHHFYANRYTVERARQSWPRVRVVITIHGEPDRSIGIAGNIPPHLDADAIHVVEPGLLDLGHSLGGRIPFRFIPNHPATRPFDSVPQPVARTVWLPFSHVPHHKDRELFDALEHVLVARGWRVAHCVRMSNIAVRQQIASTQATWVQAQGYYDLLTMETWQAGRVALVQCPAPGHLVEWAAALGFQPANVPDLRDPEAVAGFLETPEAVEALVKWNRDGMLGRWNERAAGHRWRRFYEEVLG